MFGQEEQRKPEQLVFHPQTAHEYNVPQHQGGANLVQQWGYRPVYRDYACGACGKHTNGRVLCDVKRATDGATLYWCLCACENKEPTIIVEKEGNMNQLPQPKQFRTESAWPSDLSLLYEEAAKSFAAGAFTSASMVCRKILMACVCHEQDKACVPVEEGKSFAFYVDYLANNILNFPQAKMAIDAIRSIGNDANHHVAFVKQVDAEKSLRIVGHLLNTIYVLPTA